LHWLFRSLFLVCGFSLNGLEATAIKIKELGDVFVGFGGRRSAESGGWAGGAADADRAGYKSQKVERNIFIATCAERSSAKCVHK
jgi:hypothetical protein